MWEFCIFELNLWNKIINQCGNVLAIKNCEINENIETLRFEYLPLGNIKCYFYNNSTDQGRSFAEESVAQEKDFTHRVNILLSYSTVPLFIKKRAEESFEFILTRN